MKTKKFIDKIIIPITSISITIISIWFIAILLTGSKSYYKWQYEKANTLASLSYYTEDSLYIEFSQEDLDLMTETIIDYLFYRSDSMQVEINGLTVFSNQALNHMEDVRVLYRAFTILSYFLIFILLISFVYIYYNFDCLKQTIFTKTISTYFIVIGILVLIALYMILDFDNAFVLFHKIAFPNPDAFEDAFFGTVSNYQELPHINNLLLVEILNEEIFAFAGFMIILGSILTSFSWTLFTYFKSKKSLN